MDKTTYEQAASLNPDGSHGSIVCAACHADVNENGVPKVFASIEYNGKPIGQDFGLAVEFIHATAKDLGGTGGSPYSGVELDAGRNE